MTKKEQIIQLYQLNNHLKKQIVLNQIIINEKSKEFFSEWSSNRTDTIDHLSLDFAENEFYENIKSDNKIKELQKEYKKLQRIEQEMLNEANYIRKRFSTKKNWGK